MKFNHIFGLALTSALLASFALAAGDDLDCKPLDQESEGYSFKAKLQLAGTEMKGVLKVPRQRGGYEMSCVTPPILPRKPGGPRVETQVLPFLNCFEKNRPVGGGHKVYVSSNRALGLRARVTFFVGMGSQEKTVAQLKCK